MIIPPYIDRIKDSGEWTLFLDRDGTINKRLPGDYVRSWHQFDFLPGVLDALQVFTKYFKYIFIVTNQQGIGKELMTHEDLQRLHERMLDEFSMNYIFIDEIYYCPDLASYDSINRKPNPGMALRAHEEYGDVFFKKSLMVGDTESDMLFGKNLNMKTIWINNREPDILRPQEKIIDLEVSSLNELAMYLL